jgi:TruD family tRNA pseudouridine synthase
VRIHRVPSDFRVVEQFDSSILNKSGSWRVYNVTKKGLTTTEVLGLMVTAAGVEKDQVSATGYKAKEGIAGQLVSVLGGAEIKMAEPELMVRSLGRCDRALLADDVHSNAFEVVVRDLRGDDMRRLRHNMAQVRDFGMPAYFDDQRFGCLRHGQGFVVRNLIKGDLESAVRSLVAAASPYGPDAIESYKAGIRDRWGNWEELAKFTHGRRGQSLFEHLRENPGDFEGAMRIGLSSRERTIHLYAYQSHLWNRAAALWVRQLAGEGKYGWLPCDEGSLPVPRQLSKEALEAFKSAVLPLPGQGAELDENAVRLYKAVFEAEGFSYDDFVNLDLPGFRPISEPRALYIQPEYLRAAPAERDELYELNHKMRVRFTLPRGQYANLVLKRLLMPTEEGCGRLCMWVARHPLVWPEDNGRPNAFEYRQREEGRDHRPRQGGRDFGNRNSGYRDSGSRGGGYRDSGHRGGGDSRGGGFRSNDSGREGFRPRRDDSRDRPRYGRDDSREGNRQYADSRGPWQGRQDSRDGNRDRGHSGGGYQGNREDSRGGGYQGNRDDSRGGGYRGNRDDSRGGGYRGNRDDSRGGGYQGNRGDSRGGGYQGNRDGSRGGGYQGNRDGSRGGGYQGNRDGSRGGGYQGNRDDSRGGGYQGNRDDSRGGGFRPRRDDSGGFKPRRDDAGGGYRPRRSDSQGSYNERRASSGGGNWQNRGDSPGDSRGGGYRDSRSDSRGGGGGGYRNSRDDQRSGGGGYRDSRSDSRGGGGYRNSRDDQRGGGGGGGYGRDRQDSRNHGESQAKGPSWRGQPGNKGFGGDAYGGKPNSEGPTPQKWQPKREKPDQDSDSDKGKGSVWE